jgi:hypothetical protein
VYDKKRPGSQASQTDELKFELYLPSSHNLHGELEIPYLDPELHLEEQDNSLPDE